MSFDRFWSAYPRHVAKGAAQKAWEKLSPDEEMTTRIILSITAQKSYRWKMEEMNGSLPEKQKKFVPDWKHPATWLNQACWDDEIPSVVQAKIDSVAEICPCGQPAFNRKLCSRCYTKLSDPDLPGHIKHTLRKIGFTKSKDESWRDACMRTLQENRLTSLIPENLK